MLPHRKHTPLEASEIDALRKDREDGIPLATRYGITRTSKIAHLLVGHVGLGAECSATAHQYLPARDATRVCARCTEKKGG